MLGRIVKYNQARLEVYNAVNALLGEIFKANPELGKICATTLDEDGLMVYIGNEGKLFKKICGQITVIADEEHENFIDQFESYIFTKLADGSVEKTKLGSELIGLLNFLREELRPSRISLFSNLKEIGNEFELIDSGDNFELNINLGHEKAISTTVDGISINLKYNSSTTDSELARSIMKIYFGKARS